MPGYILYDGDSAVKEAEKTIEIKDLISNSKQNQVNSNNNNIKTETET